MECLGNPRRLPGVVNETVFEQAYRESMLQSFAVEVEGSSIRYVRVGGIKLNREGGLG